MKQRSREEEKVQHLFDGLRFIECVACRGLGCDRCYLFGSLLVFGLRGRCGDECPIDWQAN